MNDEIRTQLGEELSKEFNDLAQLSQGSEEQRTAIDNIVKLYKMGVDEEKIDADYDEKVNRREMDKKQHEEEIALRKQEFELKQKELERQIRMMEFDMQKHREELEMRDRELILKERELAEQTRENQTKESSATIDRYIRLGIEAAQLVLPLMFYATWMKKGLAFEETGTFTSTTFRGLFNRFRPTK